MELGGRGGWQAADPFASFVDTASHQQGGNPCVRRRIPFRAAAEPGARLRRTARHSRGCVCLPLNCGFTVQPAEHILDRPGRAPTQSDEGEERRSGKQDRESDHGADDTARAEQHGGDRAGDLRKMFRGG